MNASDVLAFWFGTAAATAALDPRKEWFVKDPAFDDAIRQRFGSLVDRALAGPLGWDADDREHLAELIVLDQFPRNLYRGQARAFAGDARALPLALSLIDLAAEQLLQPVQRLFIYLPLEHAEDRALQARSVALFEALATESPGLQDTLVYAHRHQEVIARFGRFPHRNKALSRQSTPEEVEYLAQPGSGF
ncbi:MAG: DUF924 domain-containing protein [Pseudomonadota bacterium]|nr:DUF924 domain-containing protein [Pseudomonadota bacterium]